jgi:hypothetical protein
MAMTATVPAFSPAPAPRGYSIEAGEFVLVMLTKACVGETAEIVVTPPVLEALRAQEARIREMVVAATDRNPPTPFPYPEGCDRQSLLTPMGVIEEKDGLVRIAMPSYGERFVRDVVSSTGEFYPESGMYRNDGTVRPLWTVDWYASRGSVNVLRDRQRVVRRVHRDYSDEGAAIEFYEYGKLIKSYSSAELTGNHNRAEDGWDFVWDDAELDEDRETLSAGTNHHALLVFSLYKHAFGQLTTRYVGSDGKRQFSATLSRRDGTGIDLSDFQMCGPPTFQSSLVSDDTPPSRYLYAMRPEHVTWITVDDKTGAVAYAPPQGMGFFAIPFSRIRDFRPIPGPELLRTPNAVSWDPLRWAVTEIDGTQHSLIIDTRYLSYCGRSADGRIHAIGHRDTAGISFHASN